MNGCARGVSAGACVKRYREIRAALERRRQARVEAGDESSPATTTDDDDADADSNDAEEAEHIDSQQSSPAQSDAKELRRGMDGGHDGVAVGGDAENRAAPNEGDTVARPAISSGAVRSRQSDLSTSLILLLRRCYCCLLYTSPSPRDRG